MHSRKILCPCEVAKTQRTPLHISLFLSVLDIPENFANPEILLFWLPKTTDINLYSYNHTRQHKITILKWSFSKFYVWWVQFKGYYSSFAVSSKNYSLHVFLNQYKKYCWFLQHHWRTENFVWVSIFCWFDFYLRWITVLLFLVILYVRTS